MNFDLNSLANIMKMFGGMQNAGKPNGQNAGKTPQNTQKPFDKSKAANLSAKSPFAAQNGLGEQIDVSTFGMDDENKPKNDSESASGNKSPLDSILNLMSKKSDLEKMMPAFANVFSKKQQANENQTGTVQDSEQKNGAQNGNQNPAFQNEYINKAKPSKENDKSEDSFSPIRFAGYTAICALNRLYFALKNGG